jgi:riboflavin biosynthesis pyrimidine reductase
MASSIDGKIDGSALRNIMRPGEYEALHSKLGGNAWICGRTTMQQHFAASEQFVSSTGAATGSESVHVGRRADSYALSVDTLGRLRWSSNEISGDHLICILSEQVAPDYLTMLREQGISYIVTGREAVDLPRAMELLTAHFGIETLLLEGGGHINGGFLQAGLVDEISLLLLPGIDGRHEIAALFDGIRCEQHTATPLVLKSVERKEGDALWLRYDVART